MKVNKHSKKIREMDFQLFPKVAELICNTIYNYKVCTYIVCCMLYVVCCMLYVRILYVVLNDAHLWLLKGFVIYIW